MSGMCGTGLGNFPQPGDPNLNSITLAANTRVGGILVSWSYPSINAHAVAHVQVYRNTSNNFETASLLAIAQGTSHFNQLTVTSPTQYFYWIKLVSVNGTAGDLIGPASATAGVFRQDLLDFLEGGIGTTHLATALKTTIDQLPLLEQRINEEEAFRIDADDTLATILTTYGNDLAAIDTLVQEEIVERVSADNALVSAVDVILAKAEDNAAAILTEQTVRADADSALASEITTLVAGVAENAAAIVAEQSARADADDAFASQITTLVADVTSNAAAITDEQTARATADSALASDVTILYTKSDENSAAIETESTARLTADEALAETITLLEAVVDDNAALIAAETTARVTGDTALASQLTALQATVDDNVAAITTEATARSTADSAFSSQITTLQTTVGENVASISTLATVSDGLTAEWMLKTDVNGHVAGFGLYNDGATSDFIIAVDRFGVANAGLTAFPFVIEDGVIRFNGLVSFGNITGPKPPADATRNVYVGDWSPSTDYLTGDIVLYENDGYICTGDHTSGGTFDGAYWGTYTVKGAKGDKGDKGDTGDTGPAGADGANGANGADGLDGADGVTGASSTTVFIRATGPSTPSSGSSNPPAGWSSTVPGGSDPVWESVGNRAAGSSTWVWSEPKVSATHWMKPSTTLIDGNKIFTGDAYVDTLQIKGEAVSVPAGINQDTYITLTTSWQTVCSTYVDVGSGAGAPSAVLVSGFHNYQNTVPTATVYDIAMRLVAGGNTGGVVAMTHQNQTAVIASNHKFSGISGTVLFEVQVKKNSSDGTYLARNSGLVIQGVKR